MKITEMNMSDIDSVLPLYIDYYNNHEDCCWTEETAGKRIQQVLSMIDSYSLIMRDENENTIGFVMGFFKQYDGSECGVDDPVNACLNIENKINDSIDPVPTYTLSINEANSVITLLVEEGIHKPYLYKSRFQCQYHTHQFQP